ncbi:MAG TPA: iron-containing alcohol dehydrogenase [Anaeromyxobacteraceae bacterium]|nr:iron-containing alcohol dehydrogenase [Anaeromyxobacteraceae bacterium]
MITEFSFPTRIVFGEGALREVPNHLARLGVKKPLVVTDAGVVASGLLGRLVATLDAERVPFAVFDAVEPNPTGATVENGLSAWREHGCDGIVGLGGGSALDAAKGVRLLATHPLPLAQYDDARDGWRLVTNPMPPLVAIPTTAGTGSEVGRSFVVTLPETGRKTVIFAPPLMPSVAICDPALTFDLPARLTAATGMDAFTHNLEALCAKGFHPLADAMAVKGIELCGRFLVRAVKDGRDAEARAGMMIAAITGATAFQKGLGAAHALAHALTPIAGVHHGLANAIVLPYVMEFNLQAAAPRLAEAARALGEPPAEEDDLARRAVERVRAMAREAGIPPRLADVGVKESMLPLLTEKAFEDASHGSNPRPCRPADLAALLRAAL